VFHGANIRWVKKVGARGPEGISNISKRPLIKPVREKFAAACEGGECGPFIALVRFKSKPSDSDLSAIEAEVELEATRCLWPHVWIGTPPGRELPRYRWWVPSKNESLFFVDDREGRVPFFEKLAGAAAGRVPQDELEEAGRRHFPAANWCAYVYRLLTDAQLLRQREILDGRAQMVWFEGDIFAASLAALDLMAVDAPGGQDVPPNSLRRVGPSWELRYSDEKGLLPAKHYSAIPLLAKILGKPRAPINFKDLLDLQTRKLLELPESEKDEIIAKPPQEQFAQGLRGRKLGRTLKQRSWDTLTKSIRRLIHRLKMPQLEAHLQACIRFDYPFISYEAPAAAMPWQIQE